MDKIVIQDAINKQGLKVYKQEQDKVFQELENDISTIVQSMLALSQAVDSLNNQVIAIQNEINGVAEILQKRID